MPEREFEDLAERLRQQADALDAEAADLLAESTRLASEARSRHKQAAVLRARADREDDPSLGVSKRSQTALDRVRGDGLLAAAGVAVEDFAGVFEARDLARVIGIADIARATRLLLALAQLEKVVKLDDGWTLYDPDDGRVRDYIVATQTFTLFEAMEALSMDQVDATYHLDRFRRRGVIEADGADYRYLDTPRERQSQRDRSRRPPERTPPAYTDVPKRGEPVRIVDHGKRAQATTRHREKLRDQRHAAMEEAKRERSERDKAKARGN
jgi:hypothetical protein